MRSNKERWLRGGAVAAWIAVLACAAFAVVNFTRKDWRDFTPVEKIGFFTPDRMQWGPPATLRYPPSEIVTATVSGPMGSFLLVWPNQRPNQRPMLARVGADPVQEDVTEGSVVAKAIDECLVRGIRSETTIESMRDGMQSLRTRLARHEAKPAI
jgi:hypothetical protein